MISLVGLNLSNFVMHSENRIYTMVGPEDGTMLHDGALEAEGMELEEGALDLELPFPLLLPFPCVGIIEEDGADDIEGPIEGIRDKVGISLLLLFFLLPPFPCVGILLIEGCEDDEGAIEGIWDIDGINSCGFSCCSTTPFQCHIHIPSCSFCLSCLRSMHKLTPSAES